MGKVDCFPLGGVCPNGVKVSSKITWDPWLSGKSLSEISDEIDSQTLTTTKVMFSQKQFAPEVYLGEGLLSGILSHHLVECPIGSTGEGPQMTDRDTKTTMSTEDMHESKVSIESQDSNQDARPQGLFHNIKVLTIGQGREGPTKPSS